MLRFLAAHLSGPTRRQLEASVKCVACRAGVVRYVWLWGTDVAVTLCDGRSARHRAVKTGEGRAADFDLLANKAMTLADLNAHVAAQRPGSAA